MAQRTRRELFSDVGRGMIAAAVGTSLGLRPRASLFRPSMTEATLPSATSNRSSRSCRRRPPAKLLPMVVDKLKNGTELRTFVGRRGAGQRPHLRRRGLRRLPHPDGPRPGLPHGAASCPSERRPLPVLKVLYRNTNRIQEARRPQPRGAAPGRSRARCRPGTPGGEALRDAVRSKDMDAAERDLRRHRRPAARRGVQRACSSPSRTTPRSTASSCPTAPGTCSTSSARSRPTRCSASRSATASRASAREPGTPRDRRARALLPQAARPVPPARDEPPARARPDDAWVEQMSQTIFESTPRAGRRGRGRGAGRGDRARRHRRGDLAGREPARAPRRRPARAMGLSRASRSGSVHGDSIGVHACDSANAWRNMARVGNPRNAVACLILGGLPGRPRPRQPRRRLPQLGPVPARRASKPVKAPSPPGPADGDSRPRSATRTRRRACAARRTATAQLGTTRTGRSSTCCCNYAVSEDGALHAEKYYRTVTEEFASTRPAFRWRQLVALARVTASEYGRPAPGVKEACELVKG